MCEREKEEKRIGESESKHVPSLYECPHNPEKGVQSLKAKEAVVSCPDMVLGTKLWSPSRKTSALDILAISTVLLY